MNRNCLKLFLKFCFWLSVTKAVDWTQIDLDNVVGENGVVTEKNLQWINSRLDQFEMNAGTVPNYTMGDNSFIKFGDITQPIDKQKLSEILGPQLGTDVTTNTPIFFYVILYDFYLKLTRQSRNNFTIERINHGLWPNFQDMNNKENTRTINSCFEIGTKDKDLTDNLEYILEKVKASKHDRCQAIKGILNSKVNGGIVQENDFTLKSRDHNIAHEFVKHGSCLIWDESQFDFNIELTKTNIDAKITQCFNVILQQPENRNKNFGDYVKIF